MKKHNFDIRTKTIIFTVSVSALSLLILCTALIWERANNIKSQITQEFSTISEMYAHQVDLAVFVKDRDSINETLETLRLNKDVEVACVFHNEGALLGEYKASPKLKDCKELSNQYKQGYQKSHFGFYSPVQWDGQQIGKLILQTSTRGLDEAFKNAAIYTAGIGLCVLIFATFFSAYIQRFLTRQIIALQSVAKQIELDKNYKVRATKQTDDEIGDLVDSFNSMLDGIEKQNKIIENHNATLESKVKERTSALALANAELEAFSYSVSHDLKVPLREMTGHAYILNKIGDSEDQGDKDEAKESIDAIMFGSEKMSVMIDSMLTLHKLSFKDEDDIQRENIELSEIVERAFSKVRMSDPDRQCNLTVKEGLTCYGDKELLEYVFVNLIENAWKYSKNNGKQTLIEVGAVNVGGRNTYYVKDNGIGFDMKNSDKLFLPFKRLHDEKEYEGSGIGLATTKRIIGKHEGRIWVESEIGEGSVFYFTIFPEKPSLIEVAKKA